MCEYGILGALPRGAEFHWWAGDGGVRKDLAGILHGDILLRGGERDKNRPWTPCSMHRYCVLHLE